MTNAPVMHGEVVHQSRQRRGQRQAVRTTLAVVLLSACLSVATGWLAARPYPLSKTSGSRGIGSGVPQRSLQTSQAIFARLPRVSINKHGAFPVLCRTVQDQQTQVKTTKLQPRYGSSPEARRKASVPNARGFGLKLILLGKPASGKGTQAPLIARKYRCVHVSVGNLLRAEMRVGSELGALAAKYMNQGLLLPDEVVIQIVKRRLEQDDCVQNGWILDGFPRTDEQAAALERIGMKVQSVILLDRPDEMVKEWSKDRTFDPSTGIIYHPTYNPPPPELAPWLQKRDDDNPEVIATRLQQFHGSKGALKTRYNDILHNIDSTKHEIDVFKDICNVLDKFCPASEPDVEPIRISQHSEISDLTGNPTVSLIEIIKYCNSHSLRGYLPVFTAGKHIGYVGQSLAAELLSDPGCGSEFRCELDACNPVTGEHQAGFVDLLLGVQTEPERTNMMTEIVKRMANNGIISMKSQGRSELISVWDMHKPQFCGEALFQIQRGAEVFFGIPLYGVHVNGIIKNSDGKEYVWIAKRSASKILYPGLLDQMVSHHQDSRRRGDCVWLPKESFRQNTISAAHREAAVSDELLKASLRSAGLVSYRYETSKGLVTKVLHVYDLELPYEWRPFNGDGEIDEFRLMEVGEALEHMKAHPDKWKPNAMLVLIDMAVRRGHITPDDPDYIEMAHALRVHDSLCERSRTLALSTGSGPTDRGRV